jgi:hypothetical protein
MGYTRPGGVITAGDIRIDGADIRQMAASRMRLLRGGKVAFVPQTYASTGAAAPRKRARPPSSSSRPRGSPTRRRWWIATRTSSPAASASAW